MSFIPMLALVCSACCQPGISAPGSLPPRPITRLIHTRCRLPRLVGLASLRIEREAVAQAVKHASRGGSRSTCASTKRS